MTGFHHLSCPAITGGIIRPTPRHRTSSPYRRYTWSFSPSGVRLPVLPPVPVSSYLTFSPLSRRFGRDGYFLLHYYTLTDIFRLGRMVLCAVRTFLPVFFDRKTGRWNGQLKRKGTKNLRNIEILLFLSTYLKDSGKGKGNSLLRGL